MSHPYTDFLIEKAKSIHGRVAVPDAQFDERVLEAALIVHDAGWLDVVLTGSRAGFESCARRAGLEIGGMEIIDPDEMAEFGDYCREYGEIRAKENLTLEQIDQILREPIYLACMLHRHGKVEGICSGVHYSTGDMARACIKILGMQPGIKKMTSLVALVFNHTPFGDDKVYITADPAIVPDPTAEELADIAVLAADKARAILPEEPRLAMLSFSTVGSAEHPMVDKVLQSLAIIKERRPDIKIDGEFQLDSAISAFVAEKKVKRPSEVAGRANVLISPDIQSGNLFSKAMLLMGDGFQLGPVFLGLNGCANDNTRGAKVEAIVNNIAFVGAQIQR